VKSGGRLTTGTPWRKIAGPADETMGAPPPPRPRAAVDAGRTPELVSEVVNEQVDVDVVHDLLAALLIRYHARRAGAAASSP